MEHDFVAEIAGRLTRPPVIYAEPAPRAVLYLEVHQQIWDARFGRQSRRIAPVVVTEDIKHLEVLMLFKEGDPIHVWSRQLQSARPWFREDKIDDATGQRGVWAAGREKYVIDHFEAPRREETLPNVFSLEIEGELSSEPAPGRDKYGPFGQAQVLVNRWVNDGRGGSSVQEYFHIRAYGGRAASDLNGYHVGDRVKVTAHDFYKGPLRWDRAAGDGGEWTVLPPMFVISSVTPLMDTAPDFDVQDPQLKQERQMLAGLV